MTSAATLPAELHEPVVHPEVHPDYAAEFTHAAHLAPGRWHAPHFHGDAEGAPSPMARHAGAHRHHLQSEEFEALERLITPQVMPTLEEIRLEAARVRRSHRQPHRRLRLTFVQATTSAALLCLWLGILMAQSRSVALRNLDQKLAAEIAVVHQEISATNHSIARFDSGSSLRPMAGSLGWTPAPLANFDDISQPRPKTAPQLIPASLTGGAH